MHSPGPLLPRIKAALRQRSEPDLSVSSVSLSGGGASEREAHHVDDPAVLAAIAADRYGSAEERALLGQLNRLVSLNAARIERLSLDEEDESVEPMETAEGGAIPRARQRRRRRSSLIINGAGATAPPTPLSVWDCRAAASCGAPADAADDGAANAEDGSWLWGLFACGGGGGGVAEADDAPTDASSSSARRDRDAPPPPPLPPTGPCGGRCVCDDDASVFEVRPIRLSVTPSATAVARLPATQMNGRCASRPSRFHVTKQQWREPPN